MTLGDDDARLDEIETDSADDGEAGRLFSLPPGRALDICTRLHNAILEHRVSPGAKLSEDEVGELFGASRTVARQALHALAHSGLVTIERNRGAFVARPSRREANEVFEARALVEPRIATLAAQSATPAQCAALRAHLEREHETVAADDKGRALALSGDFHVRICDIADQQVLAGMVRALVARSSLIIALYWRRADATCESHAHLALVEALEARDGTAAAEIMRGHIVDLRSGLDLDERPAPAMSLAQALTRTDPIR
ncbi:GntR family transcriptional regulator [Albimonas sp. CAU 1670]|uniref:GntR family transcriptional regulator n=1 Tax=Albimonas sp. CAU 1670 TaxID=3032599 RepID=UPI0023DCC567|nr:GntR family transcriptional regulator [Albimonas sp. CAU 1670]MDF2233900.1 GntR family transcriptional regulator [Albimonas sp. CAU 1670]